MIANYVTNMKNYLITININIPYPKQFDYKIEASSFHTAISRAIKKMRTELGRRKIDAIKIAAQLLNGLNNQ